MWLGARYDLNLYSYESNVTVGLSVHERERLFKLRASVREVRRNPGGFASHVLERPGPSDAGGPVRWWRPDRRGLV